MLDQDDDGIIIRKSRHSRNSDNNSEPTNFKVLRECIAYALVYTVIILRQNAARRRAVPDEIKDGATG